MRGELDRQKCVYLVGVTGHNAAEDIREELGITDNPRMQR
jgi:hypothetical protein